MSRASVDSEQVAIVVLHGVPAWLDPVRPYPESGNARTAWPRTPDFAFVGQAASGVGAYRSTRSSVRLFVSPSSTWVLANSVAGDRLAEAFSASASEPPYAFALEGTFLDASAPISSTTLDTPSAARLRWIRGFDRVTGGGYALYPPRNGGLTGAFKLVYPSASEAREAADDLSRLIASGSLSRNSPDNLAGTRAVGPLLLVDMVVTPPSSAGREPSSTSANIASLRMPAGETWTGVYYHPVCGYLHIIESGPNVLGRSKHADASAWGELSGTATGNVLHYAWTEHKLGATGVKQMNMRPDLAAAVR